MFNYREEKRRFDKKLEILEKEYRAAGMSDQGIAEMRGFDLETFRKTRNETNHRADISLSESDERNLNMDQLLYTNGHYIRFESNLFEGKYGWLNDIENELLLKSIKNLSADDLELLLLVAIEGYSQAEIARIRGCSKNAISKRMKKIKSFF